MHIVFDGYPLLTTKSGVGYYTYNLIASLLKMDCENEYTILYNTSKSKKKQPISAKQTYLRYPYKTLDKLSYIPGFFKKIPMEIFLGDFDLFHGTNAWLLPVKKACTVLTIHDLAYIHYPDTIGRSSYKLLTKNLVRHAQSCNRIIAVSENTKRDIVKYLNIDPQKIDVTHLAADSIYRVIDKADLKIEFVRKKYNLPDNFILYVGNLEPRKNVPTLVRAYNTLLKRTGCDYKLVLAGGRKKGFNEIEHLIKQLHIEDKVLMTGYVELDDIPYLYNLADVFTYVSKFEGFGLPPLEAMQCGTPVIVSNVSSLPEVVGDAGILVDPLNDEEIAAALENLLNDEKLREHYSRKGQKRAANFSWEQTARITMGTYKKAYESKGI